MMHIFLLLSCALVALTTGEGTTVAPTTTAQTPAAPECPNLTAEQRKKLEESIFKEIDPHSFLIGEFHEVVQPQMNNAADGSWNCVSKNIIKIDENKLKQSVKITNSKTGNEKMANFILEKIKNGIYLIRKGDDQPPIARIYIMSARVGIVASFICSLEPAANGVGATFGNFKTWMRLAKPDDTTPYEKPLPKMSNVFVSTYVKTTSTLQEHMKTVIKELKEEMSKDVPLFGPIQDSKMCDVKTS